MYVVVTYSIVIYINIYYSFYEEISKILLYGYRVNELYGKQSL